MEKDTEDAATKRKLDAHDRYLRLILPPYTAHFKSPGYIKESTLDRLDKLACKQIIKSTTDQAAVREVIGDDSKIWTELCNVLKAAIPSLERRSFTIWDPSSVDYESTSGALIASHCPGLWKDLERLTDLISISRNVLTAGERVQDLAASFSLDTEVFRLINCCVRVTARGYDGEAATGDEEKWQWVVSAYKKLLITSLQFLNNLVAQNERRKLALWMSLFDSSTETILAPEDVPETSRGSLTDIPSNPTSKPEYPLTSYELLVAFGQDASGPLPLDGAQPLWDDMPHSDYPLPKEAEEGKKTMEGNNYALFVKNSIQFAVQDYQTERNRAPTTAEVHLDMPRRWIEMGPGTHSYYQTMWEDLIARYRQDLVVYEAKMLALTEQQPALRSDIPVEQQTKQVERKIAMLEEQLAERNKASHADNDTPGSLNKNAGAGFSALTQSLQTREVMNEDMRMLFTASAGTKILESGKAELMKRLEGYEMHEPRVGDQVIRSDGVLGRIVASRVRSVPASSVYEKTGNPAQAPYTVSAVDPANGSANQSTEDLGEVDSIEDEGDIGVSGEEDEGEDDVDEDEDDEEDDGEDEEDEEDYPGSTEDGRGLLTDVPLILGPSEIEVLPMLIMSGMVPLASQSSDVSPEEQNKRLNLHGVRTHMLLAQSNGRNLLRELLIFVAAWDLREEELYFKFMVKIMEAILNNGLMPYTYHAFRDRSRSKDIISPAQAVIMKLLTCIFRIRGEAAKAKAAQVPSQASPSPPEARLFPTPTVPSRADLAVLNFIFTEFRQHIIPQTCALIFLQGQIHAGRASPEDFPLNLWDMERMYEGVYQYLEFFAVLTEESLWKGVLGEWEMASELVTLLRELEGGIPKMSAVMPQMPRRAPYPRTQSAGAIDQAHGMAMPAHIAVEKPFEVDSPNQGVKLPSIARKWHAGSNGLLYEAETPLAYPEDSGAPLGHDLPHDQEEPSDFEWRNLKKLTVLVLSSLIWKNRKVQDQVRQYGGLEALVSCCRHDDHNPYIREHAIMCLRFAVENCEQNARVIRGMAATQSQRPSLEGGGVTLGAVEDVPREVLDTQGYETFMDSKGQVGLRRKELNSNNLAYSYLPQVASASTTSGPSSAGISKPKFTGPKLSPEKAAELMQAALRELPTTGAKYAGTLQQRNEALAKLDMAFESTERTLSKARKG